MKVVILAAGEGRRLKPLTNTIPKCLLEIKKKPLLSFILETLDDLGILKNEILIVTGHLSAKIEQKFKGYKFLFNPKYQVANNIYSLFLAQSFIGNEGFVIINSDVLLHPLLIQKILYNHLGSFLLVDDYKKLGKEGMKVKMNRCRIIQINKEIPPSKAQGEYIGLAKFSKETASKLFRALNSLVKDERTDLWYENVLNKILRGEKLYGVSTDGLPWIEIDTHKDYKRAELIVERIQKDGYFS